MNPTLAYNVVKNEMQRRGLIQSTSTRLSLTEGLNMDGDNFNPKNSTVSTAYTVAHLPNSLGNIVFGINHVDNELGSGPHIVIQYESASRRRYATMYFDLYRDGSWEVDISPIAENGINGLNSIKEEEMDLEEGVRALFEMIRQHG